MAEASDGNVTQEQLATVIKKVHSQLREDLISSGKYFRLYTSCKATRIASLFFAVTAGYLSGGEDAFVWEKHLSDKATLASYSTAMATLATGPWIKQPEGEGSRIKWCINAIKEYYSTDGKLKQLLEKDIRRLGHGNPTLVDEPHLPRSCDSVADIVKQLNARRLKLLDIGSCYNPFKDYKEMEVVAIDIAPASKVHYYCNLFNN